MYYALIMLSVAMFGGCFALNDVYRGLRGGGMKVSAQFIFTGSVASLIVLFILNGFRFEFTPFTLLTALISAASNFAFLYCSFKALERINLSLYSLFSMLGGMAFPFVQGIVFYDEKITLAKVLCFALICAALLMTVERGERKGGTLYYIGIFVLNGTGGVLSKIFTESSFEKTSAAGYTMLISACSLLISAVLLFLFRKEKTQTRPSLRSAALSSLYGGMNKVANYILVLALAHVEASVQYPMVTGGVMIVSTVISFFSKKKPGKREIASVLVAFAGLLLLFVIPE